MNKTTRLITIDDDNGILTVDRILRQAKHIKGLEILQIAVRPSFHAGHSHWLITAEIDPKLMGWHLGMFQILNLRLGLDDPNRVQHDVTRMQEAASGIFWDFKYYRGEWISPHAWATAYLRPKEKMKK